MEIDLPEVVAEVTKAFNRYEKALVTNDVAVLDDTFHVDPRTIRYGMQEILYGFDEIAAFRAARSPTGLTRHHREDRSSPPTAAITAWPRRCSIARAMPGKVGRQMQSWVKFPDGWARGRGPCQHHRRKGRLRRNQDRTWQKSTRASSASGGSSPARWAATTPARFCRKPYGPLAMGLVTFQADGRMMAVLCDGRAALSGEPRQFMSYAGNYTFEGTTLSTRVDASSDASRIGGEQVRSVRFENGAMVLAPAAAALWRRDAAPGAGCGSVSTDKRIRSFPRKRESSSAQVNCQPFSTGAPLTRRAKRRRPSDGYARDERRQSSDFDQAISPNPFDPCTRHPPTISQKLRRPRCR